MIDSRSVQISKMSALDKAVNLLTHSHPPGMPLDPKDVVELAEKFVAWILNPELKYVRSGTKETK